MKAHPPSESDEGILRAAAHRIGLQIAAVFAGMVVIVLIAAVIFLARRSLPAEVIEHAPAPGRIYIDAGDGLIALALAGGLGIIMAAIVSRFVARKAVQPLGHALLRQRLFVQDASHELRTPLAVLDARLQLAQRKAGTDSPLAEVLTLLRRDSAGLAELVDDLLLMTSDPDVPGPEATDATETTTRTVQDLQLLATEAGITLSCVPGPRSKVTLSAHLLRRMITALVENAISHTPAGGRITVTSSVVAGQVQIEVTDTGPGITGIDPGRIFDRFARGTGSGHGHARRGYGIGLALVKEAALRYGGNTTVTQTGPQGTAIALRLPTTSEAHPGTSERSHPPRKAS